MDYQLDIEYDTYNIGRSYYRKNKKCVFDPIREILVIETPEEIIRQKFVRYLLAELKVPKSKIEVEVPMTHFKKGAKGRADIVVYGENKYGFNVPLILIECKAPHVALVDEVWFQAFKYDEILGTGFIIITNGSKTYGAVWDEEDEEYYYIEEIPEYNKILNGGQFKYIHYDSVEWLRPSFKELISEKTIEKFFEYGWIGEGTEEYLYPIIANLAGFLHDQSVKFSPLNIEGLNIIEDGHRYTSYGNAAGGSWEGDYRYFILEDKDSNNQIVSMSIFGALKCSDHPRFGNRKGHTTLVVAIDDFDKRHNSLQLNIDKYTKFSDNKFTIWHDGSMTIGRSGKVKRSDVIEFLISRDSSILDSSGNIVLGSFDCNKEINWDQKSTKEFIKNVIKYAILRDEYRRIKQNKEV